MVGSAEGLQAEFNYVGPRQDHGLPLKSCSPIYHSNRYLSRPICFMYTECCTN